MSKKPKILVVVGPTASGKSDFAVVLAKKLGGEIVSADSRQVYRGMDIGTGKITKKEMGGIPHHLLDILSPKTVFTVSDFKKKGTKAVRGVLRRGKLPIVVGGTGFYISALVDGIVLPDVLPNPTLRKELASKSAPQLFQILKKLDGDYAKKIDKHNPVRLIRAIEIASELGSVPLLTTNPPYDAFYIGMNVSNEKLRTRIHSRLIKRIKNGMLEEICLLWKNGLSIKRMEDLGLEYRYGARYLIGLIDKKTMLGELETAIVQYAKRQMTWFKRNKNILWVSPMDTATALEKVEEFLK